MAEEVQFSSRTENKRKYDDQPTPPPSTGPRRPTGFSAPLTSSSPDSTHAPPTSYNNVPPPVDEIQLAKQRAQEIAARLFSNAEAKRPRNENGVPTDEPNDKGFSSSFSDLGQKPTGSQFGNSPSSSIPLPVAYGFQGSSKKIDIPSGRVGVIIGKGGETIKYLQLQSGAKIQVTRDMDADPNSLTRLVELVGSSEQITKAEHLITEVLSEAEAGGSGVVSRRFMGQAGAEQFSMKVPNNKVGLIIGKGGETIKNMQHSSGARIQLIPLHLPPGDTSTERTVYIDGSTEQIESAKQLVNEVISENRVRNPSMGGGYSQQGYRPPRPPTSWGPPGPPPMQQPGYGYMQPGAYPGAPPQYNTQVPYTGYPPQATTGWDQTSAPPSQQTTQGGGYDYYSQQPSQQQQAPQGGSSTPADNTGYNYSQPPASNYNQQQGSYGESNYSQPSAGQQQGYTQDGYNGGYHTQASQPGYAQPQTSTQSGYDQTQGYSSQPTYGTGVNPTQDGVPPSYGTQAAATQASPAVQTPAGTQQGYTGQQPATTTPSYPSQVPTQPGYGVPPTSQPGYGSQPPAQTGYGQPASLAQPGYGPPQGQKPPSQAAYGQTQSGYAHSQPPTTQPGAQSDSNHQRPPPAYGSAATQPGYAQQPYGAAPVPQASYGQQPYGDSYGNSGYSQPPAYSNDNSHGTFESASGAQPVPQSGVAKASPPS